MIRTVQHLAAIDPGFNPDAVLTLRVSIPRARDAADGDDAARRSPVSGARAARARARAARRRRPPASAPICRSTGSSSAVFYTAEGQPAIERAERPRAYVHRVVARFLQRRCGFRCRAAARSRTPSAPDVATSVIVSEHVAKRFWPGQDPIGKRIKFGAARRRPVPGSSIVGVVGEVKYRGLPDNPTTRSRPLPSVPRPQLSRCRSSSAPASTPRRSSRRYGRRFASVDPSIPVFGVATMAS